MAYYQMPGGIKMCWYLITLVITVSFLIEGCQADAAAQLVPLIAESSDEYSSHEQQTAGEWS